MKKTVMYHGINYNISTVEFGFDSQRLVVNNEESSFWTSNSNLLEVKNYVHYARKAIEEYINRHKAKEAFKKWDGIL